MNGQSSGDWRAPDCVVGDVVAGRYELKESLSGSSLRQVFRAYDREVDVEVALWLLSAEGFGGSEQALAAAERTSTVRNAHVLRLFDRGMAGEANAEWLYISWQLGTSATLESLLASGTPASSEQVWRMAEGIGGALVAAQAAGIAHSWFSPADVVEVAGQVKVCGLGLLEALDADWVVPRCGAAVRYVPPEVLRGGCQRGGAAGDLYSFAMVLVDLASGHAGATVEEALTFVATNVPLLSDVLSPLLSPDPTHRPTSLPATLEALRLALGQPKGRRVASTIVDERLASEESFEIGGLLSDDDDDDATEVHVPGGHLAPPMKADRPVSEEPPSTSAGFNPASNSDEYETPAHTPAAMASVQAVSLKPVDVPVQRPQRPYTEPAAKPRLRSLTSLPGAAAVRQDLGNFAPRRAASSSTSKASSGRRLWLAAAMSLALGGAVLSLVLAMRGHSSDDETAAENVDAASVVQPIQTPPAPILTACLGEMIQHRDGDGPGFCIDPYESPGRGRTPQAGIPLTEAVAQCAVSGRRLCTDDEWERACKGRGDSSWPYGTRYAEEICNVSSGAVGLAGSSARCRSSFGVYDMSGNVAEWVADGGIRGGSATDRSRGKCSKRRSKPRQQEAYSDVGFRCCADAIDPNAPRD